MSWTESRRKLETMLEPQCRYNGLFYEVVSQFSPNFSDNQWNSSKHAGFSSAEPWMRVNDDFGEWNVATQQNDPESVLHFWRKLIQLRKDNAVLVRISSSCRDIITK